MRRWFFCSLFLYTCQRVCICVNDLLQFDSYRSRCIYTRLWCNLPHPPFPSYTSLPPSPSSPPPPASVPLHATGFNNKTTDCLIKTTSINHKRNAYTGRPTQKKSLLPPIYTRVYNNNNMYVRSIVRDPSHDLYIIHTRCSSHHHWFSELTAITERCKLRCFFLSLRCHRCSSTLYNIIIIVRRYTMILCCIMPTSYHNMHPTKGCPWSGQGRGDPSRRARP